MYRKTAFDDLTYPPGFYPGEPGELKKLISSFRIPGEPRAKAVGAIVPHAGLVYSGAVAKAVYDSCEIPATAVLLGPSHRGAGRPFALWAQGAWETPFGALAVDEALAEDIARTCPHVEKDTRAHAGEHSIEVQLPFLALARKDVKIVPISVAVHDLARLREFGETLSRALAPKKDDCIIFASSDMTHYESQKETQRKDGLALERVKALDPDGLFRVVTREGISMCGVAPATAMLFAACDLGAREAKVVAYRTSGDVTGDYDAVVGYAGVVIR
ncbi:MAG: AmmeMemoRadiSam system protein B [Planctomycetota bacterium]